MSNKLEHWEDREIVDELCDIEEGLSEWELEFVENISTQILRGGGPLSDKQRKKAQEILEKLDLL